VLPLRINNGKPWNEASHPAPSSHGRIGFLNTP
jgi:hypothetical protein